MTKVIVEQPRLTGSVNNLYGHNTPKQSKQGSWNFYIILPFFSTFYIKQDIKITWLVWKSRQCKCAVLVPNRWSLPIDEVSMDWVCFQLGFPVLFSWDHKSFKMQVQQYIYFFISKRLRKCPFDRDAAAHFYDLVPPDIGSHLSNKTAEPMVD